MQIFRYLISAPKKVGEYVWAPSYSIAKEYAIFIFNTKEGIIVNQVDKYDFAFTVGAASVRTCGDTLQACIQNKRIVGFSGKHDVNKEVEEEFKRQQALVLIKVKEDLDKIKNFKQVGN